MRRSLLLPALFSLLALGARPALKQLPARDALLAADREYAREARQKGLEGFMTLFTDDAVSLPLYAPLVEGKPAIRDFMAKAYETPGFTLTWTPLRADVSGSGDLGYTYGSYQATHAGPGGRPVVTQGKYVSIWRKQPDGHWKAVLDMGNPDAPPPQAPPGTPPNSAPSDAPPKP